MKCEEIQKQLSVMVDGESSPESSEKLLAHLQTCHECSAFYENARQMNRIMNSAQMVLPNSALANVVKERIARKREGESVWKPVSFWKSAPVYAMVILLALGVGNLAGNSLTKAIMNSGEENSLELIVPNGTEYLSDIFTEIAQGDQSK